MMGMKFLLVSAATSDGFTLLDFAPGAMSMLFTFREAGNSTMSGSGRCGQEGIGGYMDVRSRSLYASCPVLSEEKDSHSDSYHSGRRSEV